MTADELRVLEMRMEMLDAMLQDLVEQAGRMQVPGRTDEHLPAVPDLPAGLVFQGFLQIVADRFVDRAAHELVGLGEGDPPYFG